MEFLIGCGSSVAAETGNSLLAKTKKHIGYVFSYNNNIEILETARVHLDAKISDANRVAADASTGFRTISSTVAHWKKEAEKLHQAAQTIISHHANNRISSCPNPWSRYSSSKKAWEITQEINEKVQNAPDFGTTFHISAPNLGAKFNLASASEFESRLTVLNGVLEALKDEKVSICSICGMGGVGKTTLAKKLVQRVEADHLFAKVAMVTVSQNPNFQAIQNEIIELVGLKVDEQTMTARANRLNGWLSGNSTLLVLDDIWWKLNDEDFEAIGIPLFSERCKIVFTSRNEDECIKMGSQHNFRVGFLEDAEAWALFRVKADILTQDLNLHQTARDIASECGGLPIAIVTIATALKGKPQGIWKDSLLKLQKSSADHLNVYSRIRLSYDLLNDEEAKTCFRLCCLYPEDRNIPVEDLVFYGKGLQIFENVETMSQARDRVESIVHKLKKSFLLLEGDRDEFVKMHDIIRDFAISISSKHEHPYLVKYDNFSTQWPEKSVYENCSAISVECNNVLGFPDLLECPKLELFRFLNYTEWFSPKFFEGTKELKVLSLDVSSLPESIDALEKLRTLHLRESPYGMQTRYPSRIGNLLNDNMRSVEILSISTIRRCDYLLEKIPLLCNLRYLDLGPKEFDYIPPGTFSNLVKLEELYLSWTFMHWGCKEKHDKGRPNASLNEIESLPVNSIKIGTAKGTNLSEKLVRNLTRFQVFFGGSFCHDRVRPPPGHSKQLVEIFDVEASDISVSWMRVLLRKCKTLRLTKVSNLKNIMPQLIEEDGNRSGQLKEIYITGCSEIECLADEGSTCFSELFSLELCYLSNLKEIIGCFAKIQQAYFINLSELEIKFCYKLKHVFPLPVARELKQLQSIQLKYCKEMEEFFYRGKGDDELNDQVVSSRNLEAETKMQFSRNPTLNQEPKRTTCPNPCSFLPGIFRRDKQSITVPHHHEVHENTPKQSKKEVDNLVMDAIVFPRLKLLRLRNMSKLRTFYEGNEAIQMPSLQELEIFECNNMEALSYGSFDAPRLENIEINRIKYLAEGDLNSIVKKRLKGDNEDNEIQMCN